MLFFFALLRLHLQKQTLTVLLRCFYYVVLEHLWVIFRTKNSLSFPRVVAQHCYIAGFKLEAAVCAEALQTPTDNTADKEMLFAFITYMLLKINSCQCS